MDIKYPDSVTTPDKRLVYMMQRMDAAIKMGNVLGRWYKYNAKKWYVLKGTITIGEGWKGSNIYHCEIVSEHNDQSSATAMVTTPDHFVASPGINRTEYNNLPIRITSKVPYSIKLSDSQWERVKKWLRVIRARNNDEFNTHRKTVELAGADPDPTQGIGTL